MENYTCWQCGKEFTREKDEWFCADCQKKRKELKLPQSIFKGSGFYKTDGA